MCMLPSGGYWKLRLQILRLKFALVYINFVHLASHLLLHYRFQISKFLKQQPCPQLALTHTHTSIVPASLSSLASPQRSCPLWCWDTTRWAPRNLPVVPTGEKIERNLPQLRRPKCWDRGSSRCSHPRAGQRLPHISNGRKRHHFLSLLSLVALMAFLICQNHSLEPAVWM